jgi:hypothetical protein
LNDTISIASTWSVESVGFVGKLNMRRAVRDSFEELVDMFLNAYLSVNAKQ